MINKYESVFAPDGRQLVLADPRVVSKLAGEIKLAAPAHAWSFVPLG